jgi:putative aldouronate transport system substrate-binding protein
MKRVSPALFLLVLAFALVLSGCSSTKEPKETVSSNPTEGLKDGKYDPPLTLNWAGIVNSTNVFAEGDSQNNNPWTRLYEEKYGIKVNTLWNVTTPAELNTKMNLTIASGSIPDFFNVTPAQFKQLNEAGLIEDLTDVYNKYASDTIKQTIASAGPLALKSATVNGKLMGIPNTANTQESALMLFVRADWLKNLNLPEPKTMADVLKISAAFTENDPDKNGKNDTFGIEMNKDYTRLSGFFNSYHANRGLWLPDKSGKLVYSSIQPEVKTALKQLQDMYKAGQIDPEFGAKDETKVREDIASGKIGIMYYPAWAPTLPIQAAMTKNPEMDWKWFPIPSIDATPAKAQISPPINGYWVVRKGVQHPEAILKMLDEYLKIFFDSTSLDMFNKYVTSADGKISYWMQASIFIGKPMSNAKVAESVWPALEKKDSSQLSPSAKTNYDRIIKYRAGDKTMWGNNAIYGPNGTFGIILDYDKNNLFEMTRFTDAPLPSMVGKNATLQKMEDAEFTKIILGQVGIDAFDKFVASWKAAGGDEITNEVNNWYTANK